MRANAAVQPPNSRAPGPILRIILPLLGLLLGVAHRLRRSRRAAVLAGLGAAILVVASFGLSVPLASFGPKTPPLIDPEAADGARPLAATLHPAPDLPYLGPHAAGDDLRRTLSTAAALPHSIGNAPRRTALAVEAAPAAINRLVEVRRGDTLMELLVESGIQRGEAHNAITALSELFSPRRLKVGQVVRLAMLPGGTASGGAAEAAASDAQDEALRLVSLALTANPEEDVLVARQADDSFAARVEARPLARRLSAYAGTIETSLFEAAQTEGMPVETVVELIRLFSFDVDFQREIQPGDRFEVFYDSYYDRSGAVAKTGPLKYGAMVLSGNRLEFYHFVLPDGSDDHFDANGRSVRRALLKTPVDGARVSSGFGMRKHPIQGYNRMHRGVDFAAPGGTPIYAAGQGVIESIGRNGGYGNYIRIRHNSTYKTAYAHLKGYAKGMKRGVRVKQGQVIGYVGSTGNSTGPHLHYEVFVDNKQVNPQKIKLPSGKSLAGADLEAFQTARAEIDRLRGEALPDVLMVERACGGDGLPLVPASNAGETADEPPTDSC